MLWNYISFICHEAWPPYVYHKVGLLSYVMRPALIIYVTKADHNSQSSSDSAVTFWIFHGNTSVGRHQIFDQTSGVLIMAACLPQQKRDLCLFWNVHRTRVVQSSNFDSLADTEYCDDSCERAVEELFPSVVPYMEQTLEYKVNRRVHLKVTTLTKLLWQ
jgi:hypothetical protein